MKNKVQKVQILVEIPIFFRKIQYSESTIIQIDNVLNDCAVEIQMQSTKTFKN